MSDSVSKWVRLKKVLPPVMLISLTGIVGALVGSQITTGGLGMITAGWGFAVGLILGVLLARRLVKE